MRRKQRAGSTVEGARVDARVLIFWDEKNRLPEMLNKLIRSADLVQTDIATKLELPQTVISRFLDKRVPEDKCKLPLWALCKIADMLRYRSVTVLVDKRLDGPRPLSDRAIQRFLFGLSYNSLSTDALATVAHAAESFEAKTHTFYRFDPARNILRFVGGGDHNKTEFLFGPSWRSDIPTRTLQQTGATIKPYRWDKLTQSEYAKREGIKSAIGIPVHEGNHGPPLVAFFSFRESTGADRIDVEPQRVIANAIRNASALHTDSQAGDNRPLAHARLGILPANAVFRILLKCLLKSECTGARLGTDIGLELRSLARQLWPSQPHRCRVYEPPAQKRKQIPERLSSIPHDKSSVMQTECDEPVDSYIRIPPDDLVERSAVSGETIYCDRLMDVPVRRQLDPKGQIPLSVLHKLVVPIRTERFVEGWPNITAEEKRTEDSGNVLIYGWPPLDKDRQAAERNILRLGAIDAESSELILTHDRQFELNALAHIVASGIHVRESSEFTNDAAFAKWLHTVTSYVITLAADVSGNTKTITQPLQAFCDQVGKGIGNWLETDIERCDIFPFDHARGVWAKGGAYLSGNWAKQIATWDTTKKFLTDDGSHVRSEWLLPRPSGMTEQLLGHADEYHLILDCDKSRRASQITKIIGTKSLILCPCRIDLSFKSEAGLWLATKDQYLRPDFLTCDQSRNLRRIHALSSVAGLICLVMRWWGTRTSMLD